MAHYTHLLLSITPHYTIDRASLFAPLLPSASRFAGPSRLGHDLEEHLAAAPALQMMPVFLQRVEPRLLLPLERVGLPLAVPGDSRDIDSVVPDDDREGHE